jgi:hypothetical protein
MRSTEKRTPGERCKGPCQEILTWVLSALAPATKVKLTVDRRRESLRNFRYRNTLEMKDDAGRDAQVVLILRAVAEFVEAGQEIVHLDGAEREMMRDVKVDTAAERHRERIVRRAEGETIAAADVRDTEKDLTERREEMRRVREKLQASAA